MTVQIVSPEKAVEVLTIELECKKEKLEELRVRIATLEAENARLTAENESMQEDAVQNTYAFGLMLKANKEQAEEINELKGIARNLAKHLEAINHIAEHGANIAPRMTKEIRKHCEAENVMESL